MENIYLNLLQSRIAIESFAAACKSGGNFLGLPTWYKYLDCDTSTLDGHTIYSPRLTGLNDIWLVVLAVIEILLRVAMYVAIIFVVVGGFKFITSRGEANPDKVGAARKTVIDALIGLIIAVAATAVVSYIAGRFQ